MSPPSSGDPGLLAWSTAGLALELCDDPQAVLVRRLAPLEPYESTSEGGKLLARARLAVARPGSAETRVAKRKHALILLEGDA